MGVNVKVTKPPTTKKTISTSELNKAASESVEQMLQGVDADLLLENEAKQKFREISKNKKISAEKAASKASSIQFGLSLMKETAMAGILKTYALTKPLREAINKSKVKKILIGDRKSSVHFNDVGEAVADAKLKPSKYLKIGLKNIGGEAFDEGIVDPFTEDFASGYGLHEYNNLIKDRYDPAKYIQSNSILNDINNIWEGSATGLQKVSEGFLDKNSIYEGLIGAVSGIKPSINFQGILEGKPSNWKDLSWKDKITRYFTNEIITDIQEAKRNLQEDKEIADQINKVLADNKNTLLDINSLVSAAKEREDAIIDENYLKAKDSKLKMGFEALYTINQFANDGVLQHAPQVKQALQQIQDLANGKATEEQIQEQAKLLAEKGKAVTQENIEEAKTLLQKRGKQLLDIYSTINDTQKLLNSSEKGALLSENTKKQLIFNKVLEKDIDRRLKSLEEKITGNFEYFTTENTNSLFNTEEGYNTYKDAQLTIKNTLEEYKEKTEKLIKELEEKENLSEEESVKLRLEKYKLKTIKEDINVVDEELKNLEDNKEELTTEKVLSKNEILSLNPSERAMMLDSDRRHLYSKKQLKVIDALIKELEIKNPDALKEIQDAGTLYRRRVNNQDAFSRILNNERGLDDYVTYKEKTFEREATVLAHTIVAKDLTSQLDKINNDKLQATIIQNGLTSEFLEDYKKYTKKSSKTRDEIVSRTEKILKLYGIANESINKHFKEENRESIKNMLMYYSSTSKSVGELLKSLENEIDKLAEINPEMSQSLDNVLNDLANANYQRNTKILNQREKRKQEKEKQQKEKQNNRRGHKQIEKAKRDLQEAKTPLEKATAISIFDSNVYHGAEATQEEKDLFEKAKEELKAEGYEIVEMLGKAYHEGMKVTANFVEDDNLKPGETVITRVTKPLVTKDGVMIQPAEITVNQGPAIEESSNDNKKSSIEQAGEPEDVLDEDLNPDYNSPTIEEQAKQTGEVAQTINKDAIDNSNDLDEDSLDQYAGNIYPGYEVEELNSRGKLVKKTGAVPTDVMSTLYNFLEEKHIKLQEIIDFEFGKILEKNPDVKVHFVMHRTNNKAFNGYIFNVVEYTADVEKIHKDTRGGVIIINRKKYLIVGITGTNFNKGKAHEDKYTSLVSRLRNKKIRYFENSTEEYWISSEYSQVKKVQAGQKVRMLENEDSPEIRSLKDLLYDEEGNFNEERNPNHIGNPKDPDSAYEELSWYIQKGENYLPINVGNQNALELTNPSDNNGAVFLLIKGINGDLIPTKIEPIILSQLKEDSVLKNRIMELLIKVTDRDLNVRKQAKDQLRQFLVLSDEGLNITLKGKSENEISIMRNGSAIKTFKLDENFNTVDFISAVTDVEFRINITASVLNDPALLAEYDEAGAIKTDLACLAFRNASYTLYDIDSDGLPIITDTPTNKTVTKNTDSNETIRQIQYGNKRYRKEDNVYIDETDTPLLPNSAENIELIRKLEYAQIIQNMTPSYQKEGYNYYVMDSSDASPLVIKVGRSNDITIGNVNQSRQILNEIKQEAERKAQAEAARKRLKEESEDVDLDLTEDVPPLLNETQEDLDDAAFIEQETYGQTTIETSNESANTTDTKQVNTTSNKSVENLADSNNLTTFADVITKTIYKGQLFKIFKEKGWTWSNKQSDLEAFLKSKDVPLIGITNVDNWLDIIKNCR